MQIHLGEDFDKQARIELNECHWLGPQGLNIPCLFFIHGLVLWLRSRTCYGQHGANVKYHCPRPPSESDHTKKLECERSF